MHTLRNYALVKFELKQSVTFYYLIIITNKTNLSSVIICYIFSKLMLIYIIGTKKSLFEYNSVIGINYVDIL